MKTIEIPDNTNWLDLRTDDYDALEDIKIQGKVVTVPRIVTKLFQRMDDTNKDLMRQVKMRDEVIEVLKQKKP